MKDSSLRFMASISAFYIRQHRFQSSATVLTVLHLLEPEEPSYRLSLAYSLIHLEEQNRAIELLQPLLRHPRYRALAQRLHCRALWQGGHHGAARALMNRYGFITVTQANDGGAKRE